MINLRKTVRLITLVAVLCLVCCLPWLALANGGAGGSVQTGAYIITQPKSVTVAEGEKARFTLEAPDATEYQWYYRTSSWENWKAVSSNGTSDSYSLTTAARHNGYQYRCQVKSKIGSEYSHTVTLTVKTKPAITTQPKSVTVDAGKKATFKVEVTGADSYQWYYRASSGGSWKAVSSNGTSATYSLTAAARHNGYQYRCMIKNSVGSVYSGTATLTVIPKPVITTQPKSLTVNEGTYATFKVAADGAKSYQWYYRPSSTETWRAVSSNGTSATYSLTAAARHKGYQYRCKVINSYGSVYSGIATLTVKPKPAVTTQPQSVTVDAGKDATFKIAATNAVSYQWYYRTSSGGSWRAVSSNGTSATYSLTTASRHNGYQYRCMVKNSVGSVYSGVATLKVIPKPVITAKPKSQTVNEGKKATFTVAASDAKSYQWYYRTSSTGSWRAVSSNGTSATYSLTAAARHNGYQYRCKVKNSYGSVYSGIATLTVRPKPSITTQPKSVTVNEGAKATFKVAASNATGYQWYFRTSSGGNWKAVSSNGTSATYSLTAAARHNGYQYRCKVINSIGYVYSGTVTLTVKPKPVITAQPKSVTVNEGDKATFTVKASDAESYQWYYRITSSGSWATVQNSGTSATYTVTAASRHNGYQYRCLVKNSAGSVYTSPVTLTVNMKPTK